MTDSPILRRAHADDAQSLAWLHVAVWRKTYAEIAPKEAMQRLDVNKRLPYWTKAVDIDQPGQGVWLAEAQGEVQGVISLAPANHPAFGDRMEIKHLYVSTASQGQGVGQSLLTHALETCREAGCAGVALAVVSQNTAARRFYRKMGGTERGRFTDLGPLWRSDNIVMAWDF